MTIAQLRELPAYKKLDNETLKTKYGKTASKLNKAELVEAMGAKKTVKKTTVKKSPAAKTTAKKTSPAKTTVKKTVTIDGKKVCFTGTLSIKRADAEAMVSAKGGIAKKTIVKDLDYLVCASDDMTSSKAVKAQEAGVKILSEAQFLKMFA